MVLESTRCMCTFVTINQKPAAEVLLLLNKRVKLTTRKSIEVSNIELIQKKGRRPTIVPTVKVWD